MNLFENRENVEKLYYVYSREIIDNESHSLTNIFRCFTLSIFNLDTSKQVLWKTVKT